MNKFSVISSQYSVPIEEGPIGLVVIENLLLTTLEPAVATDSRNIRWQGEKKAGRFFAGSLKGFVMSFYQEHFVPHLVKLAMRNRELEPYRARVLAGAEGRVLEIGIGAGANLKLYPQRVGEILALEPSAKLIGMARRAAAESPHRFAAVNFMEASAEAIPLEPGTVDTVVMTWTLCSIPDALQALREMRRVLKPGGQLLFVEHGESPDGSVKKWQDRLTPLWKRIAGGCHLNRPISKLLEDSGFHVTHLTTGYMKRGPKAMTFLYEGIASPD
jgi:ubiquinone/menaquinone biosynthesis C-methylase UbiE